MKDVDHGFMLRSLCTCFQNPNIGLLFSVKRVFLLIALYYTGLLPFVPFHETYYEILMPSVLLKWVG